MRGADRGAPDGTIHDAANTLRKAPTWHSLFAPPHANAPLTAMVTEDERLSITVAVPADVALRAVDKVGRHD
jgi:hypothetical protein